MAMKTIEEHRAIYNDEDKSDMCIDYLIASVMVDRNIIDDVYSKELHKPNPRPEFALAALLADEAVIICSKKDDKSSFTIYAPCNDIFMWGSADAEIVEYNEINDLFDHWVRDRNWGVAVWCIKKCKMMPQPPVERSIRRMRIWNLDEMGLKESPFKKDWSIESLDKRYGKLPE